MPTAHKKAYDKAYAAKNRDKIRKNSKKYRDTHPDRCQNNYLRRFYGITLDQRDQMIADQDYKCKCCGIDLRDIAPNHVCVDHCHKTGKVRGILCRKCNVSLGLLNEDIDRINKLAQYATYCKLFTDHSL